MVTLLMNVWDVDGTDKKFLRILRQQFRLGTLIAKIQTFSIVCTVVVRADICRLLQPNDREPLHINQQGGGRLSHNLFRCHSGGIPCQAARLL